MQLGECSRVDRPPGVTYSRGLRQLASVRRGRLGAIGRRDHTTLAQSDWASPRATRALPRRSSGPRRLCRSGGRPAGNWLAPAYARAWAIEHAPGNRACPRPAAAALPFRLSGCCLLGRQGAWSVSTLGSFWLSGQATFRTREAPGGNDAHRVLRGALRRGS